jgi:hypothetical protein
MRTIETYATITDSGTLIVPIANDLPPGSYHVVVVIETAPATNGDQVASPARTPITSDQAPAAWAQLRADLSARPVGATSMAEQLDADRRERDRILMGRAADEADDVHA